MNPKVKYMDQFDPTIKDWVLAILPRESDNWLDTYPSASRFHVYGCFSQAARKAIVRDQKQKESFSSHYYPPNSPYAIVLSQKRENITEVDTYKGPTKVYGQNGMVIYVWDYNKWLKLSSSKRMQWLAQWEQWPSELRTHMLKNEKFKEGLVGIKALGL